VVYGAASGRAQLGTIAIKPPMQEAHIPIERMLEVINYCGAFFTLTEEDHLRECPECLWIFTRLVLDE
jgi:hypothetical protein